MALAVAKTITNDIQSGTELVVTVDGSAALANDLVVGINVLNTAVTPNETYFIAKKIENPGADPNWTIPATDFDFSLTGFPTAAQLTVTAIAQYAY